MLMVPPNPFREDRLNASEDYRVDWDVLDLNAKVSGWLVDEVRRLVGRDVPDPGQKIAVITGPPGYGKTHLFGRIEHQVGQDVFFVFVPAFEPEKPPLQHIRRHVVAALFRKLGDRPSPLESALARLCRPAFADYFANLPPTLAARHESIRRRLGETPAAVLELLHPIKGLAPFVRLADSLVAVLSSDAGVVRALALGWAPAPWSDTAKRWLQGQDLPEADVQALGLTHEPPTIMDVLKAIPVLFQHQQPMMICCDQIEGVAQRSELIGRAGTQSLMDLLQTDAGPDRPELFPGYLGEARSRRQGWIQCLQTPSTCASSRPLFEPRVHERLTQAIRLVAEPDGKLARAPRRSAADLAIRRERAIRQTRRSTPHRHPRGLIQDCARRFGEVDRRGGSVMTEIASHPRRPRTRRRPRIIPKPSSTEWADGDSTRSSGPPSGPSASMTRGSPCTEGVLEALKLAHSAQRLRELRRRPGRRRPGQGDPGDGETADPAGSRWWPSPAVPGEAAQNVVVVALTTIESAASFNAYFTALKKARTKPRPRVSC